MTGRTLGGPTFDRAGATADLQIIDGGVTSIKLISVLAPRASQRGGTTRRRSPTGATDAIAGCRLSGGSADRDADGDGWLHVGIRKRRGATGASTAVHHRPVPGLTPEPFPELHPRTRIGSLIRSRIPGLGQDHSIGSTRSATDGGRHQAHHPAMGRTVASAVRGAGSAIAGCDRSRPSNAPGRPRSPPPPGAGTRPGPPSVGSGGRSPLGRPGLEAGRGGRGEALSWVGVSAPVPCRTPRSKATRPESGAGQYLPASLRRHQQPRARPG